MRQPQPLSDIVTVEAALGVRIPSAAPPAVSPLDNVGRDSDVLGKYVEGRRVVGSAELAWV
jgi:hypothetical protein